MTVETWMVEFFDVDVDGIEKNKVAALEHSIKKWKGLTRENLNKHCVSIVNFEDRPELADGKTTQRFVINSRSCALCQLFMLDGGDAEANCTQCPLAQYRGGYPCDVCGPTQIDGKEICPNPWKAFKERNPQPMIDQLEQTLAFVKSC